MPRGRFEIIFEKLPDRKSDDDARLIFIESERSRPEAESIAELCRLAAALAEPMPQLYTTT